MANSVKPGVKGAHHHHRRHPHPTGIPAKPLSPPKSPGPEGHNDASSPWTTTLLGVTSAVTGFRDWADHTLHEFEQWWNRTPGSVGKHPQTGQPVAAGAPPVAAVAGEVPLEDAKTMALEISGEFEGGYKGLAGDGDGQAMSFGIIQWNFGQDTLGPLLNQMRAKNSAAFDACFVEGSNYAVLKAALIARDNPGQCKWARDIVGTHAGKKAWTTSFMNVAAVPDFIKIQHDEALATYVAGAMNAVAATRKLSPDLTQRMEFRSYAALYDLCVQENSIQKTVKAPHSKVVLNDSIANMKARIASEKPSTQLDLMKIIVVERGKMAVAASRADAISRRMGILTGAAYASTEGTVPKTRTNAKFKLIGTYGAKNVTGL